MSSEELASRLVVGLVGDIGSGKTTVANFMRQELGFRELCLANPIKTIATDVFQFNEQEVYGTQHEKSTKNKYWGISFREFATKFGTEMMRVHFPKVFPELFKGDAQCQKLGIWGRIVDAQIEKCDVDQSIVVSDCRFPDEAELVQKKHKGIVIRIDRKNNPHIMEKESAHASESEKKKISPDFVVENDGSLEELYQKISDILSVGIK
jgi:dephospho-CoA kinase